MGTTMTNNDKSFAYLRTNNTVALISSKNMEKNKNGICTQYVRNIDQM